MTKKMTISEVKEYYGGKYKNILLALEEKQCNNYEVDVDCYHYLELFCDTKSGGYLHINIGLNNKYNVWYNNRSWNNETKRYSFKTMKEVVDFIQK